MKKTLEGVQAYVIFSPLQKDSAKVNEMICVFFLLSDEVINMDQDDACQVIKHIGHITLKFEFEIFNSKSHNVIGESAPWHSEIIFILIL